ncbi:MAG: thiS [Bacilli bacterium]|nr:thiS [Bacilli bacterium]
MDFLTVKVNGAVREIEQGTTILSLLAQLGLQGRLVIVELNREILPRDAYASQVLQEADALELVHFVGGGC